MAIVLVRFIARFTVNWSSTQCHSVHGSPAAVLPCRPVLPSPTRHTHVPHLCAYETVGAATEQDCRTFHSSRRHGEAGGNPSPRTPSARQYPTLRAIFEPLGAGAARGLSRSSNRSSASISHDAWALRRCRSVRVAALPPRRTRHERRGHHRGVEEARPETVGFPPWAGHRGDELPERGGTVR